MGYLDGLSSNYFHTRSDGACVFAPWGPFGYAYVVPPAARQRLIRQYGWMLGVLMSTSAARPWQWGPAVLFGIIALEALAFWAAIRLLTRQLERIRMARETVPLLPLAVRRLRTAEATGAPALWVMTLFGFAAAAVSAWAALDTGRPPFVASALFMGAASAVAAHQLRLLYSSRRARQARTRV